MSDNNNFARILVYLSKEEFQALRDSAAIDGRHPREQVRHIIRSALLKDKPAKLDHITAPPTVEDFNALVDCINALAEMVTA